MANCSRRRSPWRAAVVATILVASSGCGDTATPAEPGPVVLPPGTPTAILTGTMIVTSSLTSTGGYQYTTRIELRESGGVAAAVTYLSVAFSPAFGWEEGQNFYGPEAWPDGTVVPPNGTLTSKPLVIEEASPPMYRDTVFAEVLYDDALPGRSFVIRGASPVMPEPPPDARFTLSGVVQQPPFKPLGDAVVEVTGGVDARRKATTDADGRFTLPGLRAGTFNVAISRPGFQTASTKVELKSNRTITHRLEPS